MNSNTSPQEIDPSNSIPDSEPPAVMLTFVAKFMGGYSLSILLIRATSLAKATYLAADALDQPFTKVTVEELHESEGESVSTLGGYAE